MALFLSCSVRPLTHNIWLGSQFRDNSDITHPSFLLGLRETETCTDEDIFTLGNYESRIGRHKTILVWMRGCELLITMSKLFIWSDLSKRAIILILIGQSLPYGTLLHTHLLGVGIILRIVVANRATKILNTVDLRVAMIELSSTHIESIRLAVSYWSKVRLAGGIAIVTHTSLQVGILTTHLMLGLRAINRRFHMGILTLKSSCLVG